MSPRILVATIALALAGCATTGPYVWVDTLPADGAQQGDLVIKDNDIIHVRVFNQDPLSTDQKVRSDGKISLPVVGEITARDKKPSQLAREVEQKLKSVIVAPSVSIAVEQNAQLNVSVVGEVKQNGVMQMQPGSTVLDALAAAGGLSDYADSDKIFVIRKGLPKRVRFRYSALRAAEKKSIEFTLQSGDIVVVE